MNPFTLLALLGDPEFQRGLWAGILGLGLLALLTRVLRLPGWLVGWGLAALAALAWSGGLTGSPLAPDWGLPAVVGVTLIGTAAIAGLARRAPAWAVGLVFALWVLGVWGTVPDTERARVPMGVTAALLPALWPRWKVGVGWAGALLAVGLLGFVAITDGAPRTSAVIGSLGMVGMPVVAAAAAVLRRGGTVAPVGLVVAQVAHVIVSGRVAGTMTSPAGAVAVVIASALLTGVLVPVQRGSSDGPPPSEVLLVPKEGRRRSGIPLLTGFERPRKKR